MIIGFGESIIFLGLVGLSARAESHCCSHDLPSTNVKPYQRVIHLNFRSPFSEKPIRQHNYNKISVQRTGPPSWRDQANQ
jgi:hypothetical protein